MPSKRDLFKPSKKHSKRQHQPCCITKIGSPGCESEFKFSHLPTKLTDQTAQTPTVPVNGALYVVLNYPSAPGAHCGTTYRSRQTSRVFLIPRERDLGIMDRQTAAAQQICLYAFTLYVPEYLLHITARMWVSIGALALHVDLCDPLCPTTCHTIRDLD